MPPLREFVEQQLGDVEVLARPKDAGLTRVLHVRDDAGREWFAKRVVNAERFRSEVRGYELWSGVRGVATPAAVDRDAHCLLLRRLRGRQPSGQSVTALLAAGRLLRRLHDTPVPSTWPSTWRETTLSRVRRLLDDLDAAALGVAPDLVRRSTQRLVDTRLPEVATHGDFQPHNWLRSRHGALSVIDFEAASRRPAAFDVARLHYAACWGRPRLAAALGAGYGRALSAAERAYVLDSLPVHAVTAINIGLQANRPLMVAHGREVLRAAAEQGA